MNRKRSRAEDEDWSPSTGCRVAEMLQSKSRKVNLLSLKDNSSQVGFVTTPVNAERAVLPLSDITHQPRDPKCLLGQQNSLSLRRRRRDPRRSSSPASPTSTDLVSMTTEKSPCSEERPGNETVTYVNNLFSPVNKLQAIPLTLDELRRRTEYPENFGRSEMVTYLRHSKTTGNEILTKYDLKPSSDRSRLNVLSRLCESEAKTLANGIHKMNTEYFPMSYVADTMKKQMAGEEERSLPSDEVNEKIDASESKETIANTINLIQNLKKFLKEPDEDLAKDLETFEKATHTFGCQNIVNHISFLETYLKELQKKL